MDSELKKIRRYKLIIIDEVGYIPFDQDAANLFNLPFGKVHLFARTCA
jgi:DNA replication protein DnaC